MSRDIFLVLYSQPMEMLFKIYVDNLLLLQLFCNHLFLSYLLMWFCCKFLIQELFYFLFILSKCGNHTQTRWLIVLLFLQIFFLKSNSFLSRLNLFWLITLSLSPSIIYIYIYIYILKPCSMSFYWINCLVIFTMRSNILIDCSCSRSMTAKWQSVSYNCNRFSWISYRGVILYARD
jgi:hypothetical protein